MNTLIAFVVVLGVLIVIHEFGHFIVARLSGVGVERFSIGFGPVLWRYRSKETEYCVSAIPFGGYVKMVGDDENPLEGGGKGGADPLKAFDLKPIWIRALIVFAGPAMNFVLAAAIFAGIFIVYGQVWTSAVVGPVTEGGPAARAGLRMGDRILAVEGRRVETWEGLLIAVHARGGETVQVRVANDAGERTVALTPVKVPLAEFPGDEREIWDVGASPLVPPTVQEVVAGDPADRAGLRPGDTVLAVEGEPVVTWAEMARAIRRRPSQPTRLELRRGAETLTVIVTPKPIKERLPDGGEIEVGRIGIGPPVIRLGPLRAAWQGVERAGEVTALTAMGVYQIVVGKLDRSHIGSPIQIAVEAGRQAQQGVRQLAFFTAVLSVNLFLLNLLPVPLLDGGHLLFFGVEAVMGRPLSVRKREVAQQVGLLLLLMLMVFAVYNDLIRYDVFRFFR